jgi:thymidylate kinase
MRTIAVDGLDGTGKGTLQNKLADYLTSQGSKVFRLDFPFYDLPTGVKLKQLLSDGGFAGLSLEDRMKLYAENRKEGFGKIQEVIDAASENDVLIFDRFWTSNLMTFAYYAVKNPEILTIDSQLDIYKKIQEFDSDFVSKFNFQEVPIIVPMLNPEIAIDRIKMDETRAGKVDSYEKIDVQQIAYDLYKDFASRNMANMMLVDIEGLTPEEVAERVISLILA